MNQPLITPRSRDVGGSAPKKVILSKSTVARFEQATFKSDLCTASRSPDHFPLPDDIFSKSRPTVYDIAANKVLKDCELLGGLMQVMRNCAVPLAERTKNYGKNFADVGLWFVPSEEEIKKSLSCDGAQVLLVVGSDDRLWGAYLYNSQARSVEAKDEKLCLRVARGSRLEMNQIGFAGIVFVESGIEKALAEGGAGIKRRDAYLALHGLMVGECLKKGLTHLVSYVWNGRFRNVAMSAHEKLGWVKLTKTLNKRLKDILVHSYIDPCFGQVDKLKADAVVLCLNTTRQKLLGADPLISKLFNFKDRDAG